MQSSWTAFSVFLIRLHIADLLEKYYYLIPDK